ncbi:hypothetical protein BV25DRAFT_1838268 [Artomyces pyxidatus]|uniref:Uncharacterized protein n=1 Tax=Artomyces pyxidatus TaxID=48021 RepID=A0ACB8T332_9AGAM|nr:hypothetical protein BV25DRAFT_1838268 [Artomyces pyxidatus]
MSRFTRHYHQSISSESSMSIIFRCSLYLSVQYLPHSLTPELHPSRPSGMMSLVPQAVGRATSTATQSHSSISTRLPRQYPLAVMNRGRTPSAASGRPNVEELDILRCATTRLLQCEAGGVYSCDVTRRFMGVEGGPASTPDISPYEHGLRRAVIKQVWNWRDANKRTGIAAHDEWIPILYNYHIVTSPIHSNQDTSEIDLVSSCPCGQHRGHAPDAKFQADLLMSLLTLMFHEIHKPHWVRATYVKPGAMTIPPAFFDFQTLPPDTIDSRVQVSSAHNFVPSLLLQDASVAEYIIGRTDFVTKPPRALWNKVLHMDMSIPFFPPEEDPRRLCAHCGKPGVFLPSCSTRSAAQLQVCSILRFEMTLIYDHCSEKLGWRAHKAACVSALFQQPRVEPSDSDVD